MKRKSSEVGRTFNNRIMCLRRRSFAQPHVRFTSTDCYTFPDTIPKAETHHNKDDFKDSVLSQLRVLAKERTIQAQVKYLYVKDLNHYTPMTQYNSNMTAEVWYVDISLYTHWYIICYFMVYTWEHVQLAESCYYGNINEFYISSPPPNKQKKPEKQLYSIYCCFASILQYVLLVI